MFQVFGLPNTADVREDERPPVNLPPYALRKGEKNLVPPWTRGDYWGVLTQRSTYTTSTNFFPAVGKLPTRTPATSSASVR
jgi:hypothetical protein